MGHDLFVSKPFFHILSVCLGLSLVNLSHEFRILQWRIFMFKSMYPEEYGVVSTVQYCNIMQLLISKAFLVKYPSGDCHGTSLIISQHWFIWQVGAVRHQAIRWANVGQGFCKHVASLGVNQFSIYIMKCDNPYWTLLYTHISILKCLSITATAFLVSSDFCVPEKMDIVTIAVINYIMHDGTVARLQIGYLLQTAFSYAYLKMKNIYFDLYFNDANSPFCNNKDIVELDALIVLETPGASITIGGQSMTPENQWGGDMQISLLKFMSAIWLQSFYTL